MKLRILIALGIAGIFAAACARNDYQASFTVVVAHPPSHPDPTVLYDPPDADTFTQILNAARFWSKYVEPRLGAEADKGKIRAGFGVTTTKVASAPEPETFEFRIHLRMGGEPAFEAIKTGLLSYLTENRAPADRLSGGGPRIIRGQKPNQPPEPAR